ncbi:MAG: hypothetical protein Ct9H300mP16_08070 [Pseudomonadota bacterium]|nr:MAG: hypothetical protein Ct9H300mP16_08070 [Pseudomonadota bacterium]
MVVFHPLSRGQLKEVAGIQIGSFAAVWPKGNSGYRSAIQPRRLAELGFDPVYGHGRSSVRPEGTGKPAGPGNSVRRVQAGDCIVIALEGENFSFRSPVVSEAQVA